MFRKKGFTLVEILIAVIVVGILIGLSIAGYWRCVEKAKSTEAYVTIGAIRKAEETYKLERGSYVAVSDTKQINKSLGLGITPKYYDFKVVLPDQDNYIVIAERIGKDINAYGAGGRRPREPIVVAMDKSGIMDSGYGVYLGSGGLSGIGGIGESGGMDAATGTSTTVGPGSAGGSSVTSGTGVTEGTGGTGGATGQTGGTGGTAGGYGGPSITIPPPQVYDSDIIEALSMLNETTAGQYYYDLIESKDISVKYDVLSSGAWGWWQGPGENTIFINQELKTTKPESLIASIICHEATHADYHYNPESWITTTLERHPELTRDDLSIIKSNQGNELYFSIYNPETGQVEQKVVLENSLDQEYNAFANELELWKEIRGSDSDEAEDYDLVLYEMGEALLKADLRTRSSYKDLPEY